MKHPSQVQSPIDAFVLAALEQRGLAFSPPAERRVLLRRLSYDLTGLPPTFEEVESFVRDPSKEAYARAVDRLLDSRRYGERWGRHWLDVARYADTKDSVLQFGKDRLRPYAYTYRDYVIHALNQDTPFDRFVQEQLAADLMEPRVEPWRLAALGFLTLGRLFDNNRHDQIDDQIDTMTRGFLGLTVACARCHDHKYDAITMADYYGLYGVFASSEYPYDLPLIEDPRSVPGGIEFEQKLAEARQRIQEMADAEFKKLREAARQRLPDYLVRVATTQPDLAETAIFFLSLAPDDLRPQIVTQWRRFVKQRATVDDPVFGRWAELMSLPDDDFSGQAARVLAERRPGMNPLVEEALQQASLTNKAEVARVYGNLLLQVHERSEKSRTGAARADVAGVDRVLLELVTGNDSPACFRKASTPQLMSRTEKDKYGGLVRELDKLAAQATNTPPARAMVVADTPEPYEPRIFLRGSPANLGPVVPRAFLQVLAQPGQKPFRRGSGRLELAQAITHPDNPLTARVIVNRIWMHYFGEPLASAPGDFGTRSDPPTHPELLDYLAARLQKGGWSLKQLHRLIATSAVYQQSTARRPEGERSALQSQGSRSSPSGSKTAARAARLDVARSVDPENKLYWHFPRRRLDFESMRDTLLFVSGGLDLTMGGPAQDIVADPLNRRRTVYALVDRQDLPGMFRSFDFACPDQSVDRRPRTTVPQQALFAMNSRLVLAQAKALAALASAEPVEDRQIAALYRRVLARQPEREELHRAADFLRAAPADLPGPPRSDASASLRGDFAEAMLHWRQAGSSSLTPLEQLAQVLLMSNELMFVE